MVADSLQGCAYNVGPQNLCLKKWGHEGDINTGKGATAESL